VRRQKHPKNPAVITKREPTDEPPDLWMWTNIVLFASEEDVAFFLGIG